jgi:hypothetical protein
MQFIGTFVFDDAPDRGMLARSRTRYCCLSFWHEGFGHRLLVGQRRRQRAKSVLLVASDGFGE